MLFLLPVFKIKEIEGKSVQTTYTKFKNHKLIGSRDFQL